MEAQVMTRRSARLGALATLGMVLATTSWGAMDAQAQQSTAPIRIRKPEPTPTPEPTPQSGEIKNLDVTPPPPLVGIKIGGGGGQTSGEDKPATPPAKPAAKSNESKDSVGDPAEIFKWVLTQPLQPQSFSWKAGDPPTLLPKVATHICLLTEVSGKFQGGGERVQLLVDKGASGGARYVLRGDTSAGAMRATAICAGREKFVPIADKQGTAIVKHWPERVFTTCDPGQQLVQKGGHPKHAVFLSTIGGKLNGGGEALVATAVKNDERLDGWGCSGMVIGGMTSHGDQIWPMVRYRTQSNRTLDVKAATFSAGVTTEYRGWYDRTFGGETLPSGDRAWLVPVDEALCGLTMISGKFQGYGEAVVIKAKQNSDGRMWWYLTVGNLTNGNVVSGGARCIARDQRGTLFGV
jgi:hypothetical protein